MTALRPTRTLSAAAAIASLLFVAGAAARDRVPYTPAADAARVVVNYSDLNLDTEAGVVVLERRLVAAARRVCGAPDPRDLVLERLARACSKAAIARAVEEVGNPRLAKLAASRNRALRG